jgi:hypothetical protein
MAERPIFIPRTDGQRLVEEQTISFKWNPGYAPIQKKKNIAALHEAAGRLGQAPLLEVSTKSEEKLGTRLSAFNLKVDIADFGSVPLESAYQGSKVFSSGGPFADLFSVSPREAKRDQRLRESGLLQGFRFEKVDWSLEPKTAFYDWLYIKALFPHREYLKRLLGYRGFTDIEFNPQKSLNCQARSCAIFVALMTKGLLEVAVADKDEFISILRPDSFAQPHSQDLRQGKLF